MQNINESKEKVLNQMDRILEIRLKQTIYKPKAKGGVRYCCYKLFKLITLRK
jgi:hypothetical protein